MKSPLVSVYIPTHNRCKLLKRAIKSVKEQTYPNIEIIVVDDGSSDGTERFMTDLSNNDHTINYIRLNVPHGANYARNKGVQASNGTFVTGLDDDDEMLPDRIAMFVENFNSEYAYICSRYYCIDDKNDKKIIFPGGVYGIITLDDMLVANITGNQVFTTKQMYLDAGMFDENLVAAQEYDLWIRMLKIKPKAKQLSVPLSNIYIHNEGRISGSPKQKTGYLQCYFKHKNLMSREQRMSRIVTLKRLSNRWPPTTYRLIMVLQPKRTWPKQFLEVFKQKILFSISWLSNKMKGSKI